jgi:hypothetical protein
MAMVTCAIMANLTYGTAIMMRTYSWQDFAGKAPWLLGSLGTVSLDIALLIQVHDNTNSPNSYTPFLEWDVYQGKVFFAFACAMSVHFTHLKPS